jgi:hypothetical protein
MISEFEFFHGAVFARMLHSGQQLLSIRPYSESDNAAYVVNDSKAVYIKYCTKRLSPWRFSFQPRHHDMVLHMKKDMGEVFICLVCNDDGVVVLTFEEFQGVVNVDNGAGDWLSAARNKRQMYLVKGPLGRLTFKVGKDDFALKMFSPAQILDPK